MTGLLRNFFLAIAAVFSLLLPPAATAQSGPAVEVFTTQQGSADSGGPDGAADQSVPLWRLPVRVSVSVNAGYDENVSNTAIKEGSLFTSGSISLSYEFGTSRTRASLSTNAGVTYYPGNGGFQYEPNLNLALTVAHQVNLRLSLNAAISVRYQAEPDFSSDLSLDRRAGNYFTSQDSLSASYQWLPRFTTVTGYALGTVLYERNAVGFSQNRFDHSFSQSFRFLYLPVTTLAASYGISFVNYEDRDRDSDTQTVTIGLDHTFSAKLRGTINAGVDFRSTANPGFQASDGFSPHVDASLSYLVGGKTSITWTANYGIEESYLVLASASQTFRTGLHATYAVTPRISATLGGNYQHNENSGPELFPGISNSFTEDSLDVSFGLSYAINRYFSANAGYSHTEVTSDLGLRSYSRNRYYGGLSVNF